MSQQCAAVVWDLLHIQIRIHLQGCPTSFLLIDDLTGEKTTKKPSWGDNWERSTGEGFPVLPLSFSFTLWQDKICTGTEKPLTQQTDLSHIRKGIVLLLSVTNGMEASKPFDPCPNQSKQRSQWTQNPLTPFDKKQETWNKKISVHARPIDFLWTHQEPPRTEWVFCSPQHNVSITSNT